MNMSIRKSINYKMFFGQRAACVLGLRVWYLYNVSLIDHGNRGGGYAESLHERRGNLKISRKTKKVYTFTY